MARNDYEGAVIDQFKRAAEEFRKKDPSIRIFQGQGGENRFDPGWGLESRQQFQFGDLRVETDNCTIVVEVESAGGVTNLAKYWPLLQQTSSRKRFALIHVFRVASGSDYISHRKLWDFLVRKMEERLAHVGWEAHLFTCKGDEPESLESAISKFGSLLEGRPGKAAKLQALERAKAVRDRIFEATGKTFDTVAAVDEVRHYRN